MKMIKILGLILSMNSCLALATVDQEMRRPLTYREDAFIDGAHKTLKLLCQKTTSNYDEYRKCYEESLDIYSDEVRKIFIEQENKSS